MPSPDPIAVMLDKFHTDPRRPRYLLCVVFDPDRESHLSCAVGPDDLVCASFRAPTARHVFPLSTPVGAVLATLTGRPSPSPAVLTPEEHPS